MYKFWYNVLSVIYVVSGIGLIIMDLSKLLSKRKYVEIPRWKVGDYYDEFR